MRVCNVTIYIYSTFASCIQVWNRDEQHLLNCLENKQITCTASKERTARKRPHCTKKVRVFCDCRLPDDGQEPMAFCSGFTRTVGTSQAMSSSKVIKSHGFSRTACVFTFYFWWSVTNTIIALYILFWSITNAMHGVQIYGPPWIYRGPHFSRWNIFCSKYVLDPRNIFG